jgi:hypothetical protein
VANWNRTADSQTFALRAAEATGLPKGEILHWTRTWESGIRGKALMLILLAQSQSDVRPRLEELIDEYGGKNIPAVQNLVDELRVLVAHDDES